MNKITEISFRLELAKSIAHQAGLITLKYFQGAKLAIERKPDDSPVTIADRSAELSMRQKIQTHFPQDAILGEELEDLSGDSGYRWILEI